MLPHDVRAQPPADLPWSQVTRFLLAVGQQLELQDADGNSFVVLTRHRYDELQAAASTAARTAAVVVPRATLTERERECLQLVSTGLTTADVAQRLGLAQNTVAQHLASVRRRYGVRSSLAAAAAARAHGVIA